MADLKTAFKTYYSNSGQDVERPDYSVAVAQLHSAAELAKSEGLSTT